MANGLGSGTRPSLSCEFTNSTLQTHRHTKPINQTKQLNNILPLTTCNQFLLALEDLKQTTRRSTLQHKHLQSVEQLVCQLTRDNFNVRLSRIQFIYIFKFTYSFIHSFSCFRSCSYHTAQALVSSSFTDFVGKRRYEQTKQSFTATSCLHVLEQLQLTTGLRLLTRSHGRRH